MQKALNERQVAVLQWISDGCPDGVMADSSYKVSALALKNRKLVRVRRTATSWHAEVTEAGQRFLADGTLPTPAAAPATPALLSGPPKAPSERQARAARRAAREEAARKLEELARQVVATIEAEGVYRWSQDDPDAPEVHELRAAVDRHGNVPVGQALAMESGRSMRDLAFVFKDAAVPEPLQAVPMPARLTKPHPVAARLQDEADALDSYDRACRQRIVRIVHALAAETERRGFKVRPRARTSRHSYDPNLFYVVCHRADIAITIYQRKERRKHEPTAAERRRLEADPKAWVLKYGDVRSDRLCLRVEEGSRRWQQQWCDEPNARLEDRLDRVLQAFALRRDELQLQEREESRKREETQRAWERAMAEAQAAAAADFLRRSVDRQAAAWNEAQQVRAYAAVLEAAAASLSDHDAVAAAAAWIAQVRQRADAQDPLHRPIQGAASPQVLPRRAKALPGRLESLRAVLAGRSLPMGGGGSPARP